ncbi:HNH endonuclease [Glutamicibacter sp.]|uniref:HNH endonuclease n=1 Tax=Glutamicibacter sp. TaxID=1931995 RepID=UPI002B4829BD|nr:HNH endonuclease [Glutamicibacter sp.]HJX79001.1 HNH endonuclease [Glutamicibacter sp.]
MSNYKVTDRNAVLSALAEHDRIGRIHFLKKYGYGEAKEYVVIESGMQYDSKAIYGVAHYYQHGTPLVSNEFNGGISQVVTPLRNLGFEVRELGDLANSVSIEEAETDPKTFIVLWNPKGWPWDAETRARCQQEIRETGVFMEEWSIGGRRGGVRENDRFFLLKVGDLPRGVIASGIALGPVVERAHWDAHNSKSLTFFADIAWEVLLDEKTLLPKKTLANKIPEKNWTIPGGGIQLLPDQAQQLEHLWAEHLKNIAHDSGAAVSVVGTGVDGADGIEPEYTTATVKRRKHQHKFRRLLLGATDHPACVVCGFDEEILLEAAHLIPDSQGGPSNLENGRLLCLNHHRAHDRGMFQFEGDDDVWAEGSQPFGPPEDWSIED